MPLPSRLKLNSFICRLLPLHRLPVPKKEVSKASFGAATCPSSMLLAPPSLGTASCRFIFAGALFPCFHELAFFLHTREHCRLDLVSHLHHFLSSFSQLTRWCIFGCCLHSSLVRFFVSSSFDRFSGCFHFFLLFALGALDFFPTLWSARPLAFGAAAILFQRFLCDFCFFFLKKNLKDGFNAYFSPAESP